MLATRVTPASRNVLIKKGHSGTSKSKWPPAAHRLIFKVREGDEDKTVAAGDNANPGEYT